MGRKDKYFTIEAQNYDVLALSPYLWNNADNVELHTGDTVSEFYDLAGNGNVLFKTTHSDRPILVTGVTGMDASIKGIKFDGVDDWVNSSNLGFQNETEYEVWIIDKRNGLSDVWGIGSANALRVFNWGSGYERGRFRY